MKKETYRTGLAAEKLCCWALRLKFYRILATRYKTPVGEIDILAARGNVIVAIEVKARATTEAALESISPNQRARIASALEHFISANPRCTNANLRFDVMLVMPKHWPMHIKNAWIAN